MGLCPIGCSLSAAAPPGIFLELACPRDRAMAFLTSASTKAGRRRSRATPGFLHFLRSREGGVGWQEAKLS